METENKKARTSILQSRKLLDKEIKKDTTRRRIDASSGSEDSDASDHDELLERAFGVNRINKDKLSSDDKDLQFLTEHRRKEAERTHQRTGNSN